MKILLFSLLPVAVGLGLPVVAQEAIPVQLQWVDKLVGPSAMPVQKGVGQGRTVKEAAEASVPLLDAWLDVERAGLPVWYREIPVPQGTAAFNVVLRDAVYEPVPAGLTERLNGLKTITEEPVVRTHVGTARKRTVGKVSIEPFRRNKANGTVERLVSFRLELAERTPSAQGQGRPKSYPSSSRLSNGQWYRFSVAGDGVYKLTYSMLEELGVDMAGLNSDQINLYGSHFGMLPFVNNVERPTDLLLNAIEVVDGGDGQFGPNDHILFYASGAQRWQLVDTLFRHTKNVFTDSACFFVGINTDLPSRISPAVLTDAPATTTVTTFNDRQFIERDLTNLLKSGRTWFGELFDNTLSYAFSFNVPNLSATDSITLVVAGAARTLGLSNYSSFDITSGSGLDRNVSVQGLGESYTGPYGRLFRDTSTFLSSGNPLGVTVTFNRFNPITSIAWLDYLELNCRRELRMSGSQMSFRDLRSVGLGQVSEFVLDQSASVPRIWEITDPTDVRRVGSTVDGSAQRFKVATDSLRQFIAFRDADYLVPTMIGAVPNQNLHATALPMDLVIVCPPEFQSAAARLAERRVSDGLSVTMVSPQQIYNEFSSGARDATAIKRYMRMLYDKAGTDEALMPRYLLLFGDGSFNNVNVNPSNQNYIPSYQTEDALDPSKSYTSDDYFGLLDATEGEYTGDLMDIGVGRLPVSSVEQANDAVDKILAYDRLQLLSLEGSSCSENGDGGLADWRTHVLFASDDQEGDGYEGIIHMDQSEFLADRVEAEHPTLNVDKIFLDSYQQVSTPGGERYPQAIDELRQSVEKGLLLVNYIGHGGEVGWAHERFLDNNTILNWTNGDRLPLFMTATCEFSRWDDPTRTSAGEYVFLNPDGGGVGLMTTTRLAYSNQNFELAKKFYDHVFSQQDDLGRTFRLGDVFRETKRAISAASPGQRNHRNFCFLGDPSMRLAWPQKPIIITAITDTNGVAVDTLKALATVRIQGRVDDGGGQPLSDFNGIVIPTVFDKVQQQYSLANDGGNPYPFGLRNNVIYRGRATVTNGLFDFTFVVPLDINYQVGPGRISCYAENASTNASGYRNDILVGSTSENAGGDEQGPRVDLYINDERFVRGGMTDADPLLFGKLYDANGINTVGSSIGHDLLAVLDENTEQAIVLNDLYEADLDTYKSGEVRYRFSDLKEGSHTLRLKAWDVFNNSSEATTEFVVAASEELALDHVLNYPNPFTTYTQFFFEHNRPCTSLDVQVQIFTVAGRLVKTLGRQLTCEGYRSEGLAWNGLDDAGDKLGRGVYVYRLNVSTSEGERAEKFEKLVILR